MGILGMKIWHSGALHSPLAVNGINALVYAIAPEQVKLGHEVTLLVHEPPDSSAEKIARETGIAFLQVPTTWNSYNSALRNLIQKSAPDVVHMHSVFIPSQAALCKALARCNIPYVITPNGGLSPHILARSRWKKIPYIQLLERPRFRKAAAVSIVAPQEREEILSFTGSFERPITYIPNAVETGPLDGYTWSPPSRPTVSYLGRFDVVHKGLDLIIAMARLLPHIEFHLYGPTPENWSPTLRELMSNKSENLFTHAAVYGAAKANVLVNSTLYLQMSRWEAFGVSIAEAMYVGVPCAVSSTMNMASLFQRDRTGLVLEPDPETAARQLAAAVDDPEALKIFSTSARQFAGHAFLPRTVATQFEALYKNCLATPVV
jgi:glycosyltransferase involved in cell wall biosynthesis